MNPRLPVLLLVLLLFTPFSQVQVCVAQESTVPPSGCVALDRANPPLFVSYERRDDKAWDGRKYVNGVLLRLSNNSNCVITLTATPNYGGELPPMYGFKDGKRVRLPDVRIGSIKSGTNVGLYYLTKYPGGESLYADGDFHVRKTIYLNNGDYIFFSVPSKNFKRDGEVLVPFHYEWDTDIAPNFIVNENGMKRGFPAVKHYLLFEPDRLPREILK